VTVVMLNILSPRIIHSCWICPGLSIRGSIPATIATTTLIVIVIVMVIVIVIINHKLNYNSSNSSSNTHPGNQISSNNLNLPSRNPKMENIYMRNCFKRGSRRLLGNSNSHTSIPVILSPYHPSNRLTLKETTLLTMPP
jgi:hypothetical protein